MNWNNQTIQTYDKSANKLADYFKGIGPRVKDIELGLKLANVNGNARVVEIGCGDGRDAKEIIKQVAWYEGFDPSKGMLKIAKSELPGISFVLADALTYNYPKQLDVIFAFASLLHVNKTNLAKVFKKCAKSLRTRGIFYISLKERDSYIEELVKDNYGERIFYYYNVNLITRLAGNKFKSIYMDHQKIGHTKWLTIVLKKI
jgi:SAM-dependent methyltransferase